MIPTMTREHRLLALWQAFVTFSMTVTAGAGLADVVSQRVAGLMALVAAAMNAGTTTYLASMRPTPQPEVGRVSSPGPG